MQKKYWRIGALVLLGGVFFIAYRLVIIAPQETEEDNRQVIRETIGAFGSLTARGFDQVEILSSREIRFLASGEQEAQELEVSLQEFCALLSKNRAGKDPAPERNNTEIQLSYHHRQIPAISGIYLCK
ncbi:hypothetical protein O4H49_01805 [Kiloniella laminariae]|uniref:Uncharacterized protein n=1 Tax=Kiloniella laminariae TaxID=454162 RepID=A0ABT4LHK2_9PROT|nr:hypothetical protein [Kiloniella laminariae]MCZ4279492.1 hypothetical protein [Kiloniella laminariae]